MRRLRTAGVVLALLGVLLYVSRVVGHEHAGVDLANRCGVCLVAGHMPAIAVPTPVAPAPPWQVIAAIAPGAMALPAPRAGLRPAGRAPPAWAVGFRGVFA